MLGVLLNKRATRLMCRFWKVEVKVYISKASFFNDFFFAIYSAVGVG